MFVSIFSVEIERDILAFLIQLGSRRRRQALRQGGLTNKLVRKLPRSEHRFSVGSRCLAKASVECQRRRASPRSSLICQVEKYPLGVKIVVAERNIRSGCRGCFQTRLLCRLIGGATIRRGGHQSRRWPNRGRAHHQHKRHHDASINYGPGPWHLLVPTHRTLGEDSRGRTEIRP